jgi:DNA-directed RNA polymerase subunit H (RpoH/RPB5)
MDLLHKILKSRTILRDHLQTEWDTSVIQELTMDEIRILYNCRASKNQQIASMGQGVGCNFSVSHRLIPSHTLHIIYYSFPEMGENPVKVTKTCQEKIQNLYDMQVIQPDDSLLVILCVPLSDTVSLAIESLHQNSQNYLRSEHLRESVASEVEAQEVYAMRHFRNVHIFTLDQVTVDLSKHRLIPQHEAIRSDSEIQEILETCNATLEQLPVIERTDMQAKILRLALGDICKIKRPTTAGMVLTYRVCQ